jgi:hypothetical protein
LVIVFAPVLVNGGAEAPLLVSFELGEVGFNRGQGLRGGFLNGDFGFVGHFLAPFR